MKVLVIPDIHLKPWIFSRAAEILQEGKADGSVCLMDIPDDWNQEYNLELYEQTFHAAMDFAIEYPNTLWCYGNHDLCYKWNQRESGYSTTAATLVNQKLFELENTVFQVSGHPIQYIQKIDQVIFCHGGILENYVERYLPGESLSASNADSVLEKINALGMRELWTETSPIWYRPQGSRWKMYGYPDLLQVVGHTPIKEIARERNTISCDNFSTYRDGAPIGTEEYLILDTESWEYVTLH